MRSGLHICATSSTQRASCLCLCSRLDASTSMVRLDIRASPAPPSVPKVFLPALVTGNQTRREERVGQGGKRFRTSVPSARPQTYYCPLLLHAFQVECSIPAAAQNSGYFRGNERRK